MKRKTLRMPTVRVVPNPFLDRTSIYVTPMARGRLQVEVYNSSGDKIARLLDRHTQGGETRVIWRTSGLPPGPYLVTVKVGSSTVVRKVVKQR
jgi:ABC-type phosphate/phosphonate transport system substrate-binding protein